MIIHPTTDLLKLEDVAGEARVHKATVEFWVYGDAKHEVEPVLASFKEGKVRRVSRENWTRFVLLNTLNPRRPDWLTAAVESEFQRRLREMVRQEVRQVAGAIYEHQKDAA